ncbi:hypothetical protein KF4_020 [Vibrio phage vB_VpaS_KF4]|nr:hypothetical protein KF3_083 [Vibrio phage vB_VpaS_KF3]ATI19233.1 hypothetical protein KF4_020 [Vibrio phage vB_VpaS_KF4]AVI05119.1 hypothetical protein [Vibrio phage VP06]
MRREVSCFSKTGKLTKDMKVILDIATVIELAIVNHPGEDRIKVIRDTARRIKQSPQYRKQWAQSIINKYLHADETVAKAQQDTIDSLFSLRAAGYKTY